MRFLQKISNDVFARKFGLWYGLAVGLPIINTLTRQRYMRNIVGSSKYLRLSE